MGIEAADDELSVLVSRPLPLDGDERAIEGLHTLDRRENMVYLG
jgi:hypothetical protein